MLVIKIRPLSVNRSELKEMLEPIQAVNGREAGIHAGRVAMPVVIKMMQISALCQFHMYFHGQSVNNESNVEKRQETQSHILRKQ